MKLGERVELDTAHGNMVVGATTGRIIATFSHEAEAESFVDLMNGVVFDSLEGGERVIAFHKDWGFEIASIDETGKLPVGLSGDYADIWFALPDPDLLYS
jgi:hypothetical protein